MESSANETIAMVSTMDNATTATAEVPPLDVPAASEATTGHAVKTDGPGDFEIFFSNPENVPLEKQMPYIMMMATDCIEGFNVKQVHPYSEFMVNRKLAGGGWVRKLNANKDLVVQELKRRDASARPNKSNRGVEELVRFFTPITDLRDLAFIAKKEGEFRQKMLNVLDECQHKRENRKSSRNSLGSVSSLSISPKRRRVEGEVGGNITGESQRILHTNGRLTCHAAEKAMAAAEHLALSNDWKVSIAIADRCGNPMTVKRLNDAYPASFEMAVGKAKAAVQLGSNMGQVGDYHDVSQGGLAIIIDDLICGGIGVSGVKPARLELVADAGINALREAAVAVEAIEEGISDV